VEKLRVVSLRSSRLWWQVGEVSCRLFLLGDLALLLLFTAGLSGVGEEGGLGITQGGDLSLEALLWRLIGGKRPSSYRTKRLYVSCSPCFGSISVFLSPSYSKW
jgi:hypothetical protein